MSDTIRRPGDDPDVEPYTVLPGWGVTGFQDYNNTSGDFAVSANTWTTVTNDGLGAYTSKVYSTEDVVDLMDSQGRLRFVDLNRGDAVLVRTDLTITPSVNGTSVEIRWNLGTAFPYSLATKLGYIDDGAGRASQFVFLSHIYVGDVNTADGVGELQVRASEDSVVNNAGSAIQLLVRGAG